MFKRQQRCVRFHGDESTVLSDDYTQFDVGFLALKDTSKGASKQKVAHYNLQDVDLYLKLLCHKLTDGSEQLLLVDCHCEDHY
jgi:hypothetical protein